MNKQKLTEIQSMHLRCQVSRTLLRDAKSSGSSKEILNLLAQHHIDNIAKLYKLQGKPFKRPTPAKMINQIR